MTEPLYLTDSYRTTFSSEVLSCTPAKGGYAVVLAATAFYPEGGGQPADHGTLGAATVLDVHEKDGSITHLTDAPLAVGSTVSGTIDFARRFDHMQQHSGEHIVSGLLHSFYGYENVGFHLGSEFVVIDISGPLSPEQLCEVELAANEVVFANTAVELSFPPREALSSIDYRSKKAIDGQVRIVTIPRGDVCACCGTHVARTGEIGLIKFCGMQNYKGGVRVTMLSGLRAVRYTMHQQEQVAEISGLLSAKQPEIVSAVRRLLEAEAAAKQSLGHTVTRLLHYKAAEFSGQECPLVFEASLASDDLRRYALLLLENGATRAAVFSGQDAAGYRYALAGSDPDALCRVHAALKNELGAHGGGKDGFYQGSIAASKKTLQTFFAAAN